jgi:hypothetical protein
MAKDQFDFIDNSEEAPKPRGRSGMVWNILTILVLLTALCMAVVFLTIFIDPTSSYNPFPPPTMPVLVLTEAPTETPRALLPPTWTPTPLPEPTETPTPEPTATDLPPQPTQAGPVEGMPFIRQDGSPQYIPNIYHPNEECDWMGVAGQVIGLNDAPLREVFVQLGGRLDNENLDMLTMSGIASAYGQAGFEFVLGDTPIASSQAMYLQLLDQAGLPLSDQIYFDTYAECDKNLVIVYFKQVK